MTSIVLLLFAGASFALALHAFISYPMSLWMLRAWRRRGAHAPHKWSRPLAPTRFAICTHVADGSSLSEAKLRNLARLQAGRPHVDVLVCAEGEAVDVRALAASHGNRITIHLQPFPRGRSHAMNSLALRTRADVLVFVDAGVMLDDGALDTLDEHFADRSVGCVCASIEPTRGSATWLYRRLDKWIRRLETETGSTMGADGSLFAVRAALYHPAPAGALHGMYVSMMVLCGGHRVVSADELRVCEDAAATAAATFRTRHEVAGHALHVHRLMWPMLVRLDALTLYKYVSHKVMRWFSVYLFAAAAVCLVVGEALSGRFVPTAVLLLAAAGLWLLGRRLRLPPFAQAFEMLAALTGAGMGAASALLRRS